MPERPRLWGRVGSVLRWWPEYLVLVLLCMAVQIPVGVLALNTPLEGKPADLKWSRNASDAGPPPFAGWPFSPAHFTSPWPDPTEIRISRGGWQQRTEASQKDGQMKRESYMVEWGWPMAAVWHGTSNVQLSPSAPRIGLRSSPFIIFARVSWSGLTANSMMLALPLVMLVVIVHGRAGSRSPRRHLGARRIYLAMGSVVGLGLLASVASSALAAESMNSIHRDLTSGFAAKPWLTPVDGAMRSRNWPFEPDPSWSLPLSPPTTTVLPINAGAGFLHVGRAQRPEGEYIGMGFFYGWPLASFVTGTWNLMPAPNPDGTPGQQGVQQLRQVPLHINWSGFILSPLLAVLVLWPLVFGLPRLAVWWVVRHRRQKDQCVTCRYDCYGLERCPECRRVVEASGASPTRERGGI
jgi:hypothetical protein